MKKVTVTCENVFTGEEETVDLYFHLTQAELTMLNLSMNGKFENYNENKESISPEENVKMFEALLEKAYGQKTADGLFIKDETAKKAFLCSPAYSALLMKLINGEENVFEFIIACLPKEIASKMSITEDGQIKVTK